MGRQRPNEEMMGNNTPSCNSNDGLFVLLQIGGNDVNCLVDTGATLSILHPSRYEAIPYEIRPKLEYINNDIRMADGGLVKLQGRATFTIVIDGEVIRTRMVIADVEVPAVMGYDFLHRYNCQIDIVQQLLTINGLRIQCMLESSLPSVFRITVAQNIVIPRASEMIVPAKVATGIAHTTRGIVDRNTESRAQWSSSSKDSDRP